MGLKRKLQRAAAKLQPKMAEEERSITLAAYPQSNGSPGGIVMRANEDCCLSFIDTKGKTRLAFVLDENGAPSVSFCDKSGHTRLFLGMSDDGAVFIRFVDFTGVTRDFSLDGLFTQKGKDEVGQ